MQSDFNAIRAHSIAVHAAANKPGYNMFVDEPVLKWERRGGELLREIAVRQTPRYGWRAENNQFYMSNTNQIHSTFLHPDDIEWQYGNS